MRLLYEKTHLIIWYLAQYSTQGRVTYPQSIKFTIPLWLDLGNLLLEFASTTNLDWGPRFANICPIRDPALPIFAQLAIKNLSKVQTRTIGRGALKFATQISPLLNLYYLIKVKKVFAKYYNGFDSSMQIITFIKQKTRTFLQICFLKNCFL